MELTEILRCPKTGNRLRFRDVDSVVHVEDSDVTYPVVDGIVDFCGEARDAVSASYDAVAPRYDSLVTSPSILMRFCNMIVWGPGDDREYADTVLSLLPSRFDGVLLDVPVGTGVFTCSLYAGFPDATIIAVDSSWACCSRPRIVFGKMA